jgi:hypothetical protein
VLSAVGKKFPDFKIRLPVPAGSNSMSALELVVPSVLPLNAKSPVLIPVIVRVSPDTAVVMFCVPAILIVSPEFKVTPVESSPTTVRVELVRYELKLGPVIVKVSPDTAVVMFCVPAILNVSPSETRVPVLSSHTNVMPCADADPVIVKVSPDTLVVTDPAPAIFMVSLSDIRVPVESSPTKVMPCAMVPAGATKPIHFSPSYRYV